MQKFFLILSALVWLTACQQTPSREVRDDFQTHYQKYGVDGTFALYDAQNDRYLLYNDSLFQHSFTPASTFKICNSLIALETGVATDENFTLKWDGVERNQVWDRDFDLKSAYQYSAVWYYQELARRIGEQRMQDWLDRADYGNHDMSGGIDQFWLDGGLRISPAQQINFLQRLRDNKLPFSQRSMDIVKKVMVMTDSSDAVLRGKTGWGGQDGQDIGWFVGYVERGGQVYYFANCVQIASSELEKVERAIQFDQSRKGIALAILKDLQIFE